MHHYEIIFIVNPDQSEQVPDMIKRYKTNILSKGGYIHRIEDWGRRQLAYMINKFIKAHYICFNIECNQDIVNDLSYSLKFNDIVIRYLITKIKSAEISPSPIMKDIQREEAKKASILLSHSHQEN